jgi:hypothetical protein
MALSEILESLRLEHFEADPLRLRTFFFFDRVSKSEMFILAQELVCFD